MMKIGHRFFRGSEFLFPEVAFSDIILMINGKVPSRKYESPGQLQ